MLKHVWSFSFYRHTPPKEHHGKKEYLVTQNYTVQVDPTLRTIALWIRITCICCDLTRCRKVFSVINNRYFKFLEFGGLMQFWGLNGVGWGCGELISLFLDSTASQGLNRKQPGVPSKIQVDSWPNRIAT